MGWWLMAGFLLSRIRYIQGTIRSRPSVHRVELLCKNPFPERRAAVHISLFTLQLYLVGVYSPWDVVPKLSYLLPQLDLRCRAECTAGEREETCSPGLQATGEEKNKARKQCRCNRTTRRASRSGIIQTRKKLRTDSRLSIVARARKVAVRSSQHCGLRTEIC